MKRHRTNKRNVKNKSWMVLSIVAVIVIVSVTIVFYNVLGSYNGLGTTKKVPKSIFDASYFYNEGKFKKYDDGAFISKTGIDVSTYQRKINWKKVKADGIEFAMIRLGYSANSDGKIHMDDRFEENIEGAKAAGIEVGVYFFSQAVNTDEAIREARYVVRHILGRGVTYPVAFDMEPVNEQDRILPLTISKRTEIADAFCQVIDRNGYTPVIYGNPHWLGSKIDLSYLTDHDIWLAHYADVPTDKFKYTMWQYTHRGKVNGIKGFVDIDIDFIKRVEE